MMNNRAASKYINCSFNISNARGAVQHVRKTRLGALRSAATAAHFLDSALFKCEMIRAQTFIYLRCFFFSFSLKKRIFIFFVRIYVWKRIYLIATCQSYWARAQQKEESANSNANGGGMGKNNILR